MTKKKSIEIIEINLQILYEKSLLIPEEITSKKGLTMRHHATDVKKVDRIATINNKSLLHP